MNPFVLSLELAFFTSLGLFVIGLPLIYCIHAYKGRLKPLIKALVSLPLVLPPTVLGYYLLLAFRPESWLGAGWEFIFDSRLAFSFTGLLFGSMIFSFPFFVNPVLSGLESLPESYSEVAYTLGKSRWQTFHRVLLPNIRSSVWVGIIMAFAHTLGEFGVVLMIGGNIPSETRTASIAIYNEVEALNYGQANEYALLLLLISVIILIIVYAIQHNGSSLTR